MVFRALHQGLNIPVAVKVLQRDALERDPRVYERLKAEARLLAQLNHPAVVRVLDFEDDAAFPYVVLEYVEGFTLSDLIQQSGSIRPHRAVRIMIQVAEGLAAARKVGIVHRDVKPANILLARDGHAKVADLGLAVVVDGISGYSLGVGPASDEAAGTVAYMSPEQFSSASGLDHRADIYSLGATFYHAITGLTPFTGGTHMEVMLKHAQETPIAPHVVVQEIDPAYSAVILKMMAKDPTARYESYDALLQALAELAAHSAFVVPQSPGLSTANVESSVRQSSSLWQTLLSSFGRSTTPSKKESDVRRSS
jgi:serine/threonine protein kinase